MNDPIELADCPLTRFQMADPSAPPPPPPPSLHPRSTPEKLIRHWNLTIAGNRDLIKTLDSVIRALRFLRSSPFRVPSSLLASDGTPSRRRNRPLIPCQRSPQHRSKTRTRPIEICSCVVSQGWPISRVSRKRLIEIYPKNQRNDKRWWTPPRAERNVT